MVENLYSLVLDELRLIMDIEKPNLYLTCSHPIEGDLNLANPYGKLTCLFLYLYNMELGIPPLYAEVNRVCRTNDLDYLESLGPYVCCLQEIMSSTEASKDGIDKVICGSSAR